MEKKPDPLAIFAHLGWVLEENGSQMLADCPFCGKRKMYVDPVKTTFSCRVCGTEGNNVTVMDRMFKKVYKPALTGTLLQQLVKHRTKKTGLFLPIEAYANDANLGYDQRSNKYVWIVRKANGMPTSLRTWRAPSPGKRSPVWSIKDTKLGLLGGEELGDEGRKDEPVYLCEGEWDRHAWLHALYDTDNPGVVVALPGANNFAKEWVEWFRGRTVVGLYDCDEAGRAGTIRAYKNLKGIAKKLQFLHWDQGRPDGYDMDDLVKEHREDLAAAWNYVHANLDDAPTGEMSEVTQGVLSDERDREKEQQDLKPITTNELHERNRKWMKLENCDLIDVAHGAAWTLYLQGNPLWMFLVAPPSGSKSEVIMPLSEWHRCHALSNMTSKSLVSGFAGPGNSDPSLLASLNGKRAVVCIKDLTPLLQGRSEELDEVFGILRDAYDGSFSKVFGNGLRRTYDKLHFTILAGVTPAIDMIGNVSMGERFLKFRADKDTNRDDDIDRAMRAVQNCGKEDAMRSDLKDAAVRALNREFNPEKVPNASDKWIRYCSELASIVAQVRGVAPTERGTDNQTMSPMTEAPPRLATQFTKLAQGLALHYESDSLDDPVVMRLVRRVALHTPDTMTTRVMQAMFHWHNKDGMSAADVHEKIHGLSRETITRILQRFYRLGIGRMQRNGMVAQYRLSDKIYSMLVSTRYFLDLPKSDVFYRGDISGPPPAKKPMIIGRKS